MIQPPKRLLYGPGPTMVEPRVYEAMSKPIVGHLDPFFFSVVEDIRSRTSRGFRYEERLHVCDFRYGQLPEWKPQSRISSSRVKSWQCSPTDSSAIASRRWAGVIGPNVVRLEKPWGEGFDESETREFIEGERPDVVAFVQAETSTGVFNPGKAISEAAHEIGALVIADTVTSLGAMPVNDGRERYRCSLQLYPEGYERAPGLSPITVSPRALERLRARKRRSIPGIST